MISPPGGRRGIFYVGRFAFEIRITGFVEDCDGK